MLNRKKRLTKNKIAGIFAETAFLTVNQSPPKNSVPNAIPAKNAIIINKISLILFVLILIHLVMFFCNPMPCNQATGK